MIGQGLLDMYLAFMCSDLTNTMQGQPESNTKTRKRSEYRKRGHHARGKLFEWLQVAGKYVIAPYANYRTGTRITHKQHHWQRYMVQTASVLTHRCASLHTRMTVGSTLTQEPFLDSAG